MQLRIFAAIIFACLALLTLLLRCASPSSALLPISLLALVPLLLVALTWRWPFDWALVPPTLVILFYGTVPIADLPTLLRWSPLVAGSLLILAVWPAARTRPTLALIVWIGAVLRCYGLGWGNGYIFHPDEQALVSGATTGVLPTLSLLTARGLELLSGMSWHTSWSVVIVGRAWSAVAGIALIGATYALGVQLLRPRWALLAAAFVATAPLLVQQSHLATPAQFDALVILIVVLLSTRAVALADDRLALLGMLLALGVATTVPDAIALPIIPAVALIVRLPTRRMHRAIGVGMCAFVGFVIWMTGSQSWAAAALVQGHAHVAELDPSSVPRAPYLYPLFAMLLWGTSPLLLQLGLFGWVAGLIQSQRRPRYRVWLPLLVGLGTYSAVVGGGPTYSLRALTALVPLLALPAALLLQLFAQRLPFYAGQRTVRLLVGTTLALTSASAIGLINVYRAPDVRVAASRWLIEHVPPSTLLMLDPSVTDPLPLGSAESYQVSRWPVDDALDQAAIVRSSRTLLEADTLVLGVAPDDLDLRALAMRSPVAACTYRALFAGQLGFVPRVSFDGSPHIGAWTIDDRRADPALRVYDHPSLYIWQRVNSPTATAIEGHLRCDLGQLGQ